MTDRERIEALPHSFADEETLLSGLLLVADGETSAIRRISPFHFFKAAHVDIGEAIKMCRRAGTPVSLDAVVAQLHTLEKAYRLDEVGGVAFLQRLSGNRPSLVELEAAFRTVWDQFRVRHLMEAARQLAADALAGGNLDAVIVRTLEDIGAVGLDADYGPADMRDGLYACISEVEQRMNGSRPVSIVPTGLADLDRLLGGGVRAGNVSIIGARPGVGKTGLLTTIACHAAMTVGIPTLIFSLESRTDVFGERLICAAGHIPNTRLRAAMLDQPQWVRLAASAKKLADAPLVIDDRSVDIDEIIRTARRWHADPSRFPKPDAPGLIAIDYLQMIESKHSEENRYQALCEISRRLKQLAKRLNVAIVASSQLNRNLEARANKHPILSDLRESGSLEDDSDVVIFVHRDSVYDADASPNDAQLIVAKHRNGTTGTVRATFLPECSRFVGLAVEDRGVG